MPKGSLSAGRLWRFRSVITTQCDYNYFPSRTSAGGLGRLDLNGIRKKEKKKEEEKKRKKKKEKKKEHYL